MSYRINVNEWFPEDGLSFSAWMEERQAILHPETVVEPEETEWTTYYVGVDVGQRVDPSAIAIVEVRENKRFEKFHYVKFIRRFPLKMLYTNVAKQLAKIDAQLKGSNVSVQYIIDATSNVGAVELIEAKMPLADVYRCFITGGFSSSFERREIRLPKSELVSTLVAGFDSNRIFLSKKSKEIDAMRIELENFEIKISDEGTETSGAKVGKHDDMVVSLGLAVWMGEQLGHRGPLFW